MRRIKKTNLAILLFLAGIGIYAWRKLKKNSHRTLRRIADEGYETAIDVMHPKKQRYTSGKLHYGPVLPER